MSPVIVTIAAPGVSNYVVAADEIGRKTRPVDGQVRWSRPSKLLRTPKVLRMLVTICVSPLMDVEWLRASVRAGIPANTTASTVEPMPRAISVSATVIAPFSESECEFLRGFPAKPLKNEL